MYGGFEITARRLGLLWRETTPPTAKGKRPTFGLVTNLSDYFTLSGPIGCGTCLVTHKTLHQPFVSFGEAYC